jgi:hypothetical protein
VNPKALCFVAMPFGKKVDLSSGSEIDFDHIHEAAIKFAIAEAGLEPLRADEEHTGWRHWRCPEIRASPTHGELHVAKQ